MFRKTRNWIGPDKELIDPVTRTVAVTLPTLPFASSCPQLEAKYYMRTWQYMYLVSMEQH
jgi:hypothetical protein